MMSVTICVVLLEAQFTSPGPVVQVSVLLGVEHKAVLFLL